MNIQATLAKCRAELKRQKEMEAKQPVLYTHSSAWREGEPGHEESKADVFRQDKAGHVVAEFYGDWQEVKDNSEYYIEVSGHNPARLKVAEDLIGQASENPHPYTEQQKHDAVYAAALLGVEVVE